MLLQEENGVLQHQNASLKQETIDLARQVRSLLKGHAQIDVDDEPVVVHRVMDAAAIISEQLVPVHNVDEMQRQNQKLMAVVRELSREHQVMQQKMSEKVRAAKMEA